MPRYCDTAHCDGIRCQGQLGWSETANLVTNRPMAPEFFLGFGSASRDCMRSNNAHDHS